MGAVDPCSYTSGLTCIAVHYTATLDKGRGTARAVVSSLYNGITDKCRLSTVTWVTFHWDY